MAMCNCKARYAEYVNGCPRCESGEAGGSHKVIKVQAETHDAIEFMNWSMLSECQYGCSDEDQWTHVETGENITTKELYKIFKAQPDKEVKDDLPKEGNLIGTIIDDFKNRKEIYIPSGKDNDVASVASHTCASSNSIEQVIEWIKQKKLDNDKKARDSRSSSWGNYYEGKAAAFNDAELKLSEVLNDERIATQQPMPCKDEAGIQKEKTPETGLGNSIEDSKNEKI